MWFGFAWWLRASKALLPFLSSFCRRHLSFFVLSTAQADGTGKEQVGEADIVGVFSEMESFQARTPSGSLRLAGLWL